MKQIKAVNGINYVYLVTIHITCLVVICINSIKNNRDGYKPCNNVTMYAVLGLNSNRLS